MVRISSSRTEVWGLAEVLSISFLSLSTITSVKKTEMVQNATFPRHKCDERRVQCDEFPLHIGKCS